MSNIDSVLSLNNPLLQTYVFYSCLLALKMLAMSVLTGSVRHSKGAFANPEDGGKAKVRVDADVERVRRAHQNDLENIPVFLFIAGLYLLTNPSVVVTTLLLRIFTAARMVHTFVYAIWVLPQPARGLSWGIGYAITLYMAVTTLLSFISGM